MQMVSDPRAVTGRTRNGMVATLTRPPLMKSKRDRWSEDRAQDEVISSAATMTAPRHRVATAVRGGHRRFMIGSWARQRWVKPGGNRSSQPVAPEVAQSRAPRARGLASTECGSCNYALGAAAPRRRAHPFQI